MADEPATTTWSIPESFVDAVQSLRRALARAGLKITGELDLSGHLHRRLLIGTPPCLLLFAAPGADVLGELSVEPGTAALIPFHIVVSARGSQTEIHLLRIPAPDSPAMVVVGRFHAQLVQAIGKIGMRSLVGA